MKLRELLQIIQGVQKKIGAPPVFICGGTPRDRYMKHLENINDIDLTNFEKSIDYVSDESAKELSNKYNIVRKVMPDGHSSIYIGSFKMDFSSNFNAPNIDALLKQVGINSPTNMQREMYSRDFTCNALLLSLNLKDVVDPTKRGFADIDKKIIRTCLSPEITLTTNKNRVVRSIYLAAKLDFDIDPAIVEFVKNNPSSVKISTEKARAEKLNEAFRKNPDRAAFYVSKMGIWGEIPITEVIRPYYLKMNKVAYFQGGGGVNKPEPKKVKYKPEPVILVQPRFEEPFYKSYDLYDLPGKYGPGAGWNSMHKYKSISEFLKSHRDKLKDKYKAEDSYIQPNGIKTRAKLFSKLIKNAIDFPLDNYSSPETCESEGDNPVGRANLTGGAMDEFLPLNDNEGKPPTDLDFGRDYTDEQISEHSADHSDIYSKLLKKYLQPETHGLYGLPDGVDLPDGELGDPSGGNPEYDIKDPSSLIYEDKWNI